MAGAIHAGFGSLTTSVYVAIEEEHLNLTKRVAAEAIEEGNRDALAVGGKAFILAEEHRWLRLLALGQLRDPVQFWNKLEHLAPYTASHRKMCVSAGEFASISAGRLSVERRIAQDWEASGTPDSRLVQMAGSVHLPEAKAIRLSAWVWAKKACSTEIYCDKLVQRSIRVPDPCVRFHGRWV